MRIGYGLAFAAGLVLGAGPATADVLSPHRWTSRLLILAAPDPADPRLARQRTVVDAARAGFGERDLVVVEALGVDPEATAIRRRFGLPAQDFRAVLVGKDGEAKITASEPIAARRLFSTIDAMPMRREEMRSTR